MSDSDIAEPEYVDTVISEESSYVVLDVQEFEMRPFSSDDTYEFTNMNTERPIMRFRGDLYDTIVSETIGTKMLFSVSREDGLPHLTHVGNAYREMMATRVRLAELHPDALPEQYRARHAAVMDRMAKMPQ